MSRDLARENYYISHVESFEVDALDLTFNQQFYFFVTFEENVVQVYTGTFDLSNHPFDLLPVKF